MFGVELTGLADGLKLKVVRERQTKENYLILKF